MVALMASPNDPADLPIYDLQQRVREALGSSGHSRLALCAPTGSGKSTQIPQMLLADGLDEGEIVVLQPRRIAARMLAMRVAAERGGSPGGEVGYQVRFESRRGP
ncbi:MAG: DEAD/DEAH box helicase family protein, partial [Hyphomicrobiales bacterium]